MLSSHRLPAALLSAALIVSGCAVERPRDVQPPIPPIKDSGSAVKPGGVGSPPINGRELEKPPALPGATSGPVPSAPTSGGVGYYQDRQEKVLNERLVGTGIRVLRNADTIKLIVPGKAFALNSEQIQTNFTPVLDNLALVLKEYSKTVVDIKGYTDSTGSFEHNQQLSERRAQSLGSYLGARQIAAARIRSAGFGPRYPLVGNDTESGRAQNRRVEIELVPLP